MVGKITILMEDGYYAPSTILWLLAETLTIRQAALLMLNLDPEIYPYAESPNSSPDRPSGYLAARQVISSALQSGKVEGTIEWQTEHVMVDNFKSEEVPIDGQLDANRSSINMESLKQWLASKNVTVEQFAGLANTSEDFLDRTDEAYSPKLAAAVAAWRHVKKHQIAGVSIKQQLIDWLKKNSARFWPDGEDAKVTDTFIKEAARIANWDAEGGRPTQKTEKNEGEIKRPEGRFEITKAAKPSTDEGFDFDDEIPF